MVHKSIVIAVNKNTSVGTLVMLANDEDHRVRKAVARNENAPADILTTLAQDKNAYIRYEVAKNPNTPYKTLVMLSHDTEFWVEKNAKKLLREYKKKEKNNIER